MIKFLLYSTFVNSFEIINYVKPQFPKLLTPCPNIDIRLLEKCSELSKRDNEESPFNQLCIAG